MAPFVQQYVYEIDYVGWCISSLLGMITQQFLATLCNIDFEFGAIINNNAINFIVYVFWEHILLLDTPLGVGFWVIICKVFA